MEATLKTTGRSSSVKMFTRSGTCVRVRHQGLTRAVDSSGEATRGFDPGFGVRRRFDMSRMDFKEELRLFSAKEMCQESAIDLIERKGVGVEPAGSLRAFPKLTELLDGLRQRLGSKKTAHHTRAMLQSFRLSEASPVDKLELFRFVRAWAVKFVPAELVGGKRNFSQLMSNQKVLLGAGKGSTLRLWQLVRGIDLDNILWANTSSADVVGTRLKQQTMVKLVVWLAEDVIWRLVLSYFHVSDISRRRNELFFYRKRHFQSLYDASLRRLVSDGLLRPLSVNKAMDVLHSEYSPPGAMARLFPKSSGGCRLLAVRGAVVESKADEARTLLSLLKDRHPEVVDNRGHLLHGAWATFTEKVAKDGAKKVGQYYMRSS